MVVLVVYRNEVVEGFKHFRNVDVKLVRFNFCPSNVVDGREYFI